LPEKCRPRPRPATPSAGTIDKRAARRCALIVATLPHRAPSLAPASSRKWNLGIPIALQPVARGLSWKTLKPRNTRNTRKKNPKSSSIFFRVFRGSLSCEFLHRFFEDIDAGFHIRRRIVRIGLVLD